MKKTTFTANLICMSAILLGTLSVRGMENPSGKSLLDCSSVTIGVESDPMISNQIVLNKSALHALNAINAEEYNQSNSLLSLPKEILSQVLSYCQAQDSDQVKSLKNSMRFFMRLRSTCKWFNQFLTLEKIGNLCKNYDLTDKNETLKRIINTINDFNYPTKRRLVLILVCAGAGANTETILDNLLGKAVSYKDEQMAAILFQHHANPNIKTIGLGPVFFGIKTIGMANVFIANGVDIHATGSDPKTTVLYHILNRSEDYPSELLELYLAKKVDATKLAHWDNSCLLHKLAENNFIRDIDDFLKKGELLLNAMPKEMVNLLDEYGKTPVDIAQASLKEAKKHSETPEAYQQLIELYRSHGGLTAQELTAQEELLKPVYCTLCLEEKPAADCHIMNGCNSVDNTISGCQYSFCKECLLEHIVIHLDEGSTHGLTCPNTQCEKEIHVSDIHLITQTNKDLYRRFLDISFAEFIMKNKGTIKKCPMPDCECSYEIDVNAIGRLKCPSCKNFYCSLCQYDHPGMTCQNAAELEHDCSDCATRHARNMACEIAARDRAQTESSLEELHNRKIKPCPNCKTFIEKDMGCNHMTCKKCRHEFCWTCLAQYGTTRCGNVGCSTFDIRTGLNF